MIKVDNEAYIPTRKFEEWKQKWELRSYLPFNYADAVHIFGKPVKVIGQEHRVYWRFVETQKDGTLIYAEVRDDGLNDKVEDTVNFNIIGHCSRSFEVVAEFTESQYIKGMRPITRDFKPPREDEETNDTNLKN